MRRHPACSQFFLGVLWCLLSVSPVFDAADQPMIVVPSEESTVFLCDQDDDESTDDGVVRHVAAVVNDPVRVMRGRACAGVPESVANRILRERDFSMFTRGPP